MRSFPFFHNLAILFFYIIGNKISCRPIRSVIIPVMNKSDSRCAVVRFCYHSSFSSPEPRSVWPAAGIQSSGFVQHRKSAIHGLPDKSGKSETITLHMLRKLVPATALDLCRRSEGSWLWGREWSLVWLQTGFVSTQSYYLFLFNSLLRIWCCVKLVLLNNFYLSWMATHLVFIPRHSCTTSNHLTQHNKQC